MSDTSLMQESPNLPIASLRRRVLAYLLDAMILTVPVAVAGHLIPVVGGFVVLFFYAPVLEASSIRATLGKYLAGIQVADPMGRRVSLKAAVIRNVLKYVTFSFFFVGFFFALFTRKKQTLHDLLADTLVVYGRGEIGITDAWMTATREVFNASGIRELGAEKSTLSSLERLQALREKGTLTEEEFQREKARLLAKA